MKNRYVRILTVMVALLLAVLTLAACNSGGENTDPVEEENPPVAEEEEEEEPEEPEDDASAAEEVTYEVNGQYVLKQNLKVRAEPSADSEQIKSSDLSENDINKAAQGEDAVLKAGAPVLCQEVNGDWMRIDSGWICCREGKDVYITKPITLWRPKNEDGSYADDFFYDEDGEKFYITETEDKLTGTYAVSGINTDSIEFFPDGTCMYHTKPGYGIPQFDENGLCDGRYNYRKGKVYFRIGGGVNADVYVIKDGELVQQ